MTLGGGNKGIKIWCGGGGGSLIGGILLYILYIHYTYAYMKELRRQVFLYNEEASCTSYTSCFQVAILLLQDLRVKDIYAIYFRVSVQCP